MAPQRPPHGHAVIAIAVVLGHAGACGCNHTAGGSHFVAHIDTSAARSTIDGHFLSLALGSWDKLAQGPGHHLRHHPSSRPRGLTGGPAGATAASDAGPATRSLAPARVGGGSFPFLSCDHYFERDPRLLEYLKPLAPGYLRFGDVR